jgi:hypothetical protein
MNLPFLKPRKQPRQQVIAIGGKKLSGKGAFINQLLMAFDPERWEVCSVSKLLLNEAASHITRATGISTSPQDILKEKEKWRPYLIKLGNRRNEAEPAGMMKTALFTTHEHPKVIFDSLRREADYHYAKEQGFKLILVDATPETRAARNGGKPLDDSDPTEYEAYELLKKDPKTWIIPNNGTWDELKAEAQRFVSCYRLSH